MRALLFALLVGLALVAVSGCSLGGGDDSSAVSTPVETGAPTLPTTPARARATSATSAIVSVADPASPAAFAVATREARKTGLPIVPGTLVRVVGAQKATGGFALWSFQAKDLILCMIVDPSGKGVAWSGSAQRFDGLERCAGAASAPSTLVLAGRARPNARAIRVVTRSGKHRAAALGFGGWLYFDGDVPLMDDRNGAIPAAVEALDGSGKVIGRERFPQ